MHKATEEGQGIGSGRAVVAGATCGTIVLFIIIALALIAIYDNPYNSNDDEIPQDTMAARDADRWRKTPKNQPDNSVATVKTTDACAGQWDALVDRFGGATPFSSWNKATPWSHTRAQIANVIEGGTIVEFPETLYSGANALRSRDVSTPSVRKRGRELAILTKRDRTIIRNIDELVNANENDTLLIVFAGMIHMFDYHLSTQRNDILYLSYPVSINTNVGNDAYRETIRQPFGFKGAIKRASAALYSEPYERLRYFRRHYQREFRADMLLKERPDGPMNKLFICDLHHIDDKTLAESLPSVQCIEKQFRSIVFAVEARHHKSVYTLAELRMYFSAFEMAKVEGKLDVIRGSYDERRYKSGEVDVFPELTALFNRLEEYSKCVTIRYTGIEGDVRGHP